MFCFALLLAVCLASSLVIKGLLEICYDLMQKVFRIGIYGDLFKCLKS